MDFSESVRVHFRTLLPSDPGQASVEVPHGLALEIHELETAQRLAMVGYAVRFRRVVNQMGVKNIDVWIDRELWEFKSPLGRSSNTLNHQLSRARKQGARRVVIDLSRTALLEDVVFDELMRRLSVSNWFLEFIQINQGSLLTHVKMPA